MKNLLLGLVILAVAASTGFAHGGSYRGPAGEVPPSMRKPEDPPPPSEGGVPTPPPEENGGGTPTPPDNGQPPGQGNPPPDSPNGGAPKPVRPDGPGSDGSGAGTATPGSKKNTGPPPMTFDSWEFWWGYNKDDILNLKARLKAGEQGSATEGGGLGVGKVYGGSEKSTQAPTELAIQKDIIPALERALDDLDLNFDIRAGAVIALGKVGSTQEKFAARIASRLIDIMRNKNGKEHFSVEESGALALGLLQNKDAEILGALCDKALDSRGKGNPRTRAFALLALGLLEVTKADAGYERVNETLNTIVKDESTDTNLPVCALTAMGLSGDPVHLDNLLAMVKTGKAYKTTKLNDLVRSYATSAVGRILAKNSSLVDKDRVDILKTAMTKCGANTVRSAVIAYGQISSESTDRRLLSNMVQTLEYIVKKGENQASNFALISLGKLAASVSNPKLRGRIFDTLRTAMKKGSYTSKPFAAISLGLMGRAANGTADRDAIREAVRFEFIEFKGDPKNRGGYAIALGMLQDQKGSDALIKVLEDKRAEKRLRGACAIALGMIKDRKAMKAIKKALAEKSSRELRVDTAVAAGLIGDSGTVVTLIDLLKDPRSSLFVQGSVSLALGRIGDRRAIEPLVQMMENEKVQDLNRALAAVALGLLGDRNDLPVMGRLSKDVNYRASTNAIDEVLTIL